ncbi:hypothetical protein ANCDUO_11101 [Ancylostoma duodenale]|uniref:Uncharacterized protein n=1 Tax=Ancylostoma duodenale TaxID=51022 RepID=A0A0C2GC88_9BILA|nr:hypothetical protein ANCDUO_11101 [Ancylostoma duodenale]
MSALFVKIWNKLIVRSAINRHDLIAFIKDRNRDPVIESALQTLSALAAKIPMELSAQVEAETRARTIVIRGLEEADSRMLPS